MEYMSFKQKQLELPREADRHFIEAEEQLKQLDASKKQDAEKTK